MAKKTEDSTVAQPSGLSPSAKDNAAPTNGATAKTEPVLAAPIRRCANK